MYIHRYDQMDKEMLGLVADVYIFTDDAKTNPFADRIAVNADGRVVWRGKEWTPEKAAWYAGCILAAFAEAFKIAQERRPDAFPLGCD